MTRFRIALVGLVCAVICTAFGIVGAADDQQSDAERELAKFQGTWTIESSVAGGLEIPADQLQGFLVIYEGDRHTLKFGDQVFQVGTQTIDPSQSPKAIDVTMIEGSAKGTVMLGIYEIDGDKLTVCFDPTGKERPTEFKSETGSQNFLNVHRRVTSTAPETTLDQPQPEHELLKRLAGEWRFEKRSAEADGAPAESLGTGTVSAELVGDFFVVGRWSGNVYGADYVASQTLGYDIAQQKYTGSWIDSTMSYRWELSGTVDSASQELTIMASGPGPAGGTCNFRERYQLDSPDSITIVGEMQQDNEWVKFMTTHLTRQR